MWACLRVHSWIDIDIFGKDERKMNKTISKVTALLAALVVAVCAMPAAVSADSTTLKGSGTQTDPYVITTAEQLQELNKQNGDVGYVQLGADIDMSNIVLENKTYVIKKLTDEFDGKGHTISNLKLEGKANTNTGLISELTGNITEVALENIDITDGISNNSIVGTLAGYIPEGSSVSIDKCIVTGNISNVTSGNVYIGGLIGCAGQTNLDTTLKVANCISNVTIKCARSNYAGGILGFAQYKTTVDASKCSILSSVTASGAYACGVVGTYRSSVILKISDVCLEGKMNGGYNYGIGYLYTTPQAFLCNGFYYDNDLNKPSYGTFPLFKSTSKLDLTNCYSKTTTEMQSLKLDGFAVVEGEYNGYPVPVWKTSGGDEPITYSIKLDDNNNAVVSAETEGTYCVVFAAYNGETLTSVGVVKRKFDADANQSVDAPKDFNATGAKTVKAMLLRSLEDIYPLCEAAQK